MRRVTRGPIVAVLLAATGCTGTPTAVPSNPTATTQAAVSSTATTTAPAASTTTAAVTTTAATATTTTAAVTTTDPAVVVTRGNPNRRQVALTFDAGADAGNTAQILDTLAAAGVTATFGLTGKWGEANPDLVRRIGAAGHQVVNHTWDHRSFTGVSARPAIVDAAARRDQLERTDRLLADLTGHTSRPWFRPPYGDYDRSVNVDVGAAGYRYDVLWTVDSLGWRGVSAASIASRCLQGAVPGAIYLFHVGSASQDAAALPAVIAGLSERGYRMVTVAEVVGD